MKKSILFSFLLCIFVVSVFYFLINNVKAEEITCTSQLGSCSSEINEIAKSYENTSYFHAKKEIAKQMGASSRIEKYIVRFSYPNGLRIVVEEKKPEVAFKFAEDKYYLFDTEGNFVGESSDSGLPVVVVRELPENSKIKQAAKLYWNLSRYYGVEQAVLERFGLMASVRGVQVVFPLDVDIDLLFGAMEVSLLQLNRVHENSTMSLDTGKYNSIDLRYKNPVIAKFE